MQLPEVGARLERSQESALPLRTSTEQDERRIRNLEVRRRRKVGFAGSADVLSFRTRGQGAYNEMVKEQFTLNINKII